MDQGKTFKIVDLKSVCRMCMTSGVEMFPIFDDSIISLSDPISLLSRTTACVGFEISQEKCLPGNICKSCLQVVDHWVVFRSRARSTNDLLMGILAKAKSSLPPSSQTKTCSTTTAQQDSSNTNTVVKENSSAPIPPANEAKTYVQIAPKVFKTTCSNILQTALDNVNLETEDLSLEETVPSLKSDTCAENEDEEVGEDDCQDLASGSEVNSDGFSSSEEFGLEESEDGTLEANIRGTGRGAWRDRPVKCPVCYKSFSKHAGVKLHLKVVHTIVRLFPCYICGYISVDSLKRKKHIRKAHKNAPKNTCLTCGIRTKTTSAYSRHMQKHSDDLCCKICGRQLDSYEDLKQHKKLDHSEDKVLEKPPEGIIHAFQCHLCENVSFFGEKDWKEHYLDVHNTQDVHPCDFCDRAYRNKTLLEIHIRSHTGEKPYMCEQCPTTFSSKGSLRNHMRKHTTRFQCKECHKTYCSGPSLAYHMRSHNKEAPYVCEQCGKKFRSKNGVEFHLRTHTGENPFKCELCDYTCKFKSSLFSHKAVHTNEKPFKCDLCDKCFKLKSWMVTHKKTHIGDKKFVCKICNHAFIANYQLKSHMKTHSGERPHVCPRCCKTFARRDTLSEHLRTHTQDAKYFCKTCSQDFVFLKSFKKHKCSQSFDELVPFSGLEMMADSSSDCFGDSNG